MFPFVLCKFSKVWIVKGEPSELVLVDGTDQLKVDGRQHWLFFRKFRVKVKNILLVFL